MLTVDIILFKFPSGSMNSSGQRDQTQSGSRPPNVDLTNKVKEKLKMFQASKEQNSTAPSQTVPLNRSEPVTSSSTSTPKTRVSRVSGDRVAAAATSPSTTTVARIANKSPASSSAVSSIEPDSVLEGIGSIQRTSSAVSVEVQYSILFFSLKT